MNTSVSEPSLLDAETIPDTVHESGPSAGELLPIARAIHAQAVALTQQTAWLVGQLLAHAIADGSAPAARGVRGVDRTGRPSDTRESPFFES